jgi:hypothetical protein
MGFGAKKVKVEGVVNVNGSLPEKETAKVSISAGQAVTYNRASGASCIEIHVESGNVRVRTDGSGDSDNGSTNVRRFLGIMGSGKC